MILNALDIRDSLNMLKEQNALLSINRDNDLHGRYVMKHLVRDANVHKVEISGRHVRYFDNLRLVLFYLILKDTRRLREL